MASRLGPRSRRVRLLGAVALLGAATAAPAVLPAAADPVAPAGAARAEGTVTLDLGASTLPESRTVTVLAPGVTLTQIVRGSDPAAKDAIATTDLGPWRVGVLSIDPRVAKGRLTATYGPDLARSETVGRLVGSAHALAGVNASYFTYTKSKTAPGEPVGLGLYDGRLRSDPAATKTEVDVLVDSRRGTLRLGRLTWTGRVRNTRTRASLTLDHLNSPPAVPKGCARLEDPRRCTRSGEVVRFDRSFAARTPKGAGAEVVLGRDGCVVRTAKTRGRRLTGGQTAIQATGRQTKALLRLARRGCLKATTTLRDRHGRTVRLRKGLYGVAGRYRLVEHGAVVVPRKRSTFFDRHPRTLIGTTKRGVVTLVTIDGTQPTSVGATLKEAARVAVSLGLTDAVNLDGGGSTTMVAAGRLVSSPSHGAERKVGDALVYVDRR